MTKEFYDYTGRTGFGADAERKLNDIVRWEGRDDVYLYASVPTPGRTRYVFGSWVAYYAGWSSELCNSEREALGLIDAAWLVAKERAEAPVRCVLCDETFAPAEHAEGKECPEAECAFHVGEDNCDDHACSFPHARVFLPARAGEERRVKDREFYTLPCVEVGGVQVYAYFLGGELRVSVDYDTADAEVVNDEGTVPTRVCLAGVEVYVED